MRVEFVNGVGVAIQAALALGPSATLSALIRPRLEGASLRRLIATQASQSELFVRTEGGSSP